MPVIKKYRAIADADIPSSIARDNEVTAAMTAHTVATDPHPTYLTQSEGDARYLNAGGGTGIAATIALADIESALRRAFKSSFFIESHYLSTAGSGEFPGSSSNGGFAYMRAEIDHPGILGLSTGSNSAGAAGSTTAFGNNSSGIILDDGAIEYVAIIKIPILRDTTNDFTIEVGFQTAGTSIGLDAVCFVCDSASLNWQCHTRSNGDLAVFTSSTPVTANQWLEMQITVVSGVADFAINGINVLSTSQKLPLSPRMVGAGIDIRKLSGTSGRDIWIDYQSVEQIFNSSHGTEFIDVQSRPLTDSDIPESIARDTEVTAAINSHKAETDPHPIYLTQAEGDGRYRQNSAAITDAELPSTIARDTEVTAAINSHKAETDPHPIYLTQAEGDARYGTSALKSTIFTGTMPTAAGNSASFIHGIPSANIRCFNCMVQTPDGIWVLPGGFPFPGYQYHCSIFQTVCNVRLGSSDNNLVAGRPYIVTIFHT
ncbi:hypothetical protein QUA82_09875 [Microcoleus sp. F8-D3]